MGEALNEVKDKNLDVYVEVEQGFENAYTAL